MPAPSSPIVARAGRRISRPRLNTAKSCESSPTCTGDSVRHARNCCDSSGNCSRSSTASKPPACKRANAAFSSCVLRRLVPVPGGKALDLVVFENNKPYVIDEFREGWFDYLELTSEVAETKFFQCLFGQGFVDQLARHYPSPRRRHHVPLWMYVSSQLSLRLHGSHSFHSFPVADRGTVND